MYALPNIGVPEEVSRYSGGSKSGRPRNSASWLLCAALGALWHLAEGEKNSNWYYRVMGPFEISLAHAHDGVR